jgi:hypothetical protein
MATLPGGGHLAVATPPTEAVAAYHRAGACAAMATAANQDHRRGRGMATNRLSTAQVATRAGHGHRGATAAARAVHSWPRRHQCAAAGVNAA